MAEEKKKLSVQEMLAAARAKKEGAAPAATPPAAAEAPAEAAAEAPKAEKPAAAKPAAAAAKPAGGKLSMAEMLAAARAKGPAAESPKAPEAPKPAPAAVEKPKPAPKVEKKEAAATTAEKETGSFLAGGPSKDKPGPMTKAEAAAKEGPGAKAAGKPTKVAPPMPEKPAYARAPVPAAKGKVEDRRGFLALALGSALGVGFTTMSATFGLWGLALARFMFPNVLREPPSAFKVGFKSDFPFGKVEEKYKAQYGVWVVNYDYNGRHEIYALSTVCTHLGCTPNWLEAEQKFKCPCHGSGFYKDGINFEGPAPRPLERYAIKISDDGQLQVDKSRKFQEEMGQWEDPASYVSV